MAESASAAAPSGGPGAKTSSSGAWWKSLTSKKKSKESPPGAPGTAWPPLPMQPAEPTELIHAPPGPPDSRDTQQPPLGAGSSRRNLKISRSGRFKEKRKVRATLLAESPQMLFESAGGGSAASCAAPAHPGDKAPCQ